jgi:metallo-beta-lactamase class B
MIKLISNVYQIGGYGLTHHLSSGVYVVIGSEIIVIDPGNNAGKEAMLENLAALGIGPQQVTKVLLTHPHIDHREAVSAFPAAEVMIHEADAAAVTSGNPDLNALWLYGLAGVDPGRVDSYLVDGQEIRSGTVVIRVIHTPGHTPGSCSFEISCRKEKLLVLGDTLGGHGHPRTGSDFSVQKVSLGRLLDVSVAPAIVYGHMLTLGTAGREVLERGFAECDQYWYPFFSLPVNNGRPWPGTVVPPALPLPDTAA